ncbi:hypothetical protein CUMW_258500 [Citrus unshiu]|uniref:Rhamnogalacturonase A/B/Epimerase-like pectate lyase domain-containing protein n=1 Tax=Citrus unshiu TaxID=55188 RepID=A0A2H5QSS7_CITUN|nr:hypothetical protein CUMW_258500 [Citrus unshiu]
MGIDATNRVFNVKDFGAVADGITDDSKAFDTAWREACNWDGIKGTVLVPPGKYLVSFAEFEGPCKASISFQLRRLLDLFSIDTSLSLAKGTFHGQGETAWPLNQCHKNSDCQLPTPIRFNFLNDSTITGIKSVDSKYFHINILGCYNLKINDLKITAHADSSKDILVSEVFCGPGQGISVGSLGKGIKDEEVVGLTVRNCTFTCTSNGVRVKTWPDSHIGIASNFTFEDIVRNNVENPIPKDSMPNIEIGNRNLVYNGANVKVEGPETTSLCSNVKPTLFGKQIPATCV